MFDGIKMIMEKAHSSGPGGTPDMATISYMRHTQRNGEPIDGIQDYVLRNWRVPPGIEKSTEQVEHMLGIPSGGANKRKFSSRAHPDQPGLSTIVGELPYEPVPSGTVNAVPMVTAPILDDQALVAPFLMTPDPLPAIVEVPAPEATMAEPEGPTPMVIEPKEAALPTPVVLGDAEMPVVASVAAVAAEEPSAPTPAEAAGAPSTQLRVYIPWTTSVVMANGGLPEDLMAIPDRNEREVVMGMRFKLNAIRSRAGAVLGFKAKTGPLYPKAARRLECLVGLLRAASSRTKPRRHFMTIAMALLVSRGAYPVFLQLYHPGKLPLRNSSLNCSKKLPTIMEVGEALANAGVDPLKQRLGMSLCCPGVRITSVILQFHKTTTFVWRCRTVRVLPHLPKGIISYRESEGQDGDHASSIMSRW
jgi:hypothetical protein